MDELKEKLTNWAKRYNNKDFIGNDPIQIPHKHLDDSKQDIEISAFVTAYLSFGNRTQIIKAAKKVNDLMGHSPHKYVVGKQWETDFDCSNTSSFYRMVSYAKMNEIFSKLHYIYTTYPSMEHCLQQHSGTLFQRICKVFEISSKSPQKKINMFLRWMVRNDGVVDFGLWKTFSPQELIIPLDTHVTQMAYKLGITNSKTYSLKNAITITDKLSEIFPNDPCLGDFALFGYGVENN